MHVIMYFVAGTNLDVNVKNYTLFKLYLQVSSYSNKTVILNQNQSFIVENAISLINSVLIRTRSFLIKEDLNIYSWKLLTLGKSVELLNTSSTTLKTLINLNVSTVSFNSSDTSTFISKIDMYLQLLQQLG